jgi:sugar phosphate permease
MTTDHGDILLADAAPGTRTKHLSKRAILLMVLLTTIFVAYLDRSNMFVLVADDDFLAAMGLKGDPARIGLLASSFLLTYGIANVVLSPLGDYLGARRAMMLSITLWAAAMVAGGLAAGFVTMLVTRVVLGVGEGMHYPMQSIFVRRWFPQSERGPANSVWLAGQSLASAAAMPFFAWNVGAFGWRSSFYLCAVLALLPLYLLWAHTTDTPRGHPGIEPAELRHIEQGMEAEASVAPGAGAVRAFLRDQRYWLLVLYNICHSAIYWGLASWIPSYLKTSRGFSWQQMGWFASLPFVLTVAAKILGGWMTDRAGRNGPFCVAAMLGSGVAIYVGSTASDNVVAALFIAIGMGMTGIGIPAAWAMTQRIVPKPSVSTASGLLNGVATAFVALAPPSSGP